MSTPSPFLGDSDVLDPKSSAIVVIGAGVTGLTTALVLRRNGYDNITVVAKHMPGDRNIEYTSPWAAANYVPVSVEGSAAEQWDRISWKEFWRLVHEAPQAGIHIQRKVSYYTTDRDESKVDWYKDMVPNYRFLDTSELPANVKWGNEWDTICIDPTLYLSYLQTNCISQGIHFKRANLSHISEAFHLHSQAPKRAALVVNCTGIMAAKLGGVEDDKVSPIKGQLVVVRNESHGMFSITDREGIPDGEHCYVMSRPFGGGTVLGGSSHNTWDPSIDMDLSKRIMQRAIQICPRLVNPGEGIEGLDVVHHSAGLRPERIGGPRIEWEELAGNLPVVHNYGTAGFGFSRAGEWHSRPWSKSTLHFMRHKNRLNVPCNQSFPHLNVSSGIYHARPYATISSVPVSLILIKVEELKSGPYKN